MGANSEAGSSSSSSSVTILPGLWSLTSFDSSTKVGWMEERWTDTFCYSGLYIIFIFGVGHLMRSRDRMSLKVPLISWNFLLASFSILGTVQMIPEFLRLLSSEGGFHRSVCMPLTESSNSWEFWTMLFILSKLPELGDTVFIVLRKQPLIFLHWYHHVTVLIYSWYSYALYVSPSRWYVVMNFLVHSIMYSYYFLKACRIRVPKVISVTITSLQILQMVLGIVINVYAYMSFKRGRACGTTYENIYFSLIMYTSYFALFAKFFHSAYLAKRAAVRKNQ